MIERPEQKDAVDARIGKGKAPRVADFGAGELQPVQTCSRLTCLFDVERDGIDQMDAIAQHCEPNRVAPGSAAYIRDRSWSRR